MVVAITYRIKSGAVRRKEFIRDSHEAAVKFFNWRYGHPILLIRTRKGYHEI
jgi:hypothetical protein